MNELKDQLTPDQQKVTGKLSKMQLIRLAGFTRRLYNNLCASCKAVAYNQPQQLQNYNSLCDTCQENDNIIRVFHGLQELNNEIKGKE